MCRSRHPIGRAGRLDARHRTRPPRRHRARADAGRVGNFAARIDDFAKPAGAVADDPVVARDVAGDVGIAARRASSRGFRWPFRVARDAFKLGREPRRTHWMHFSARADAKFALFLLTSVRKKVDSDVMAATMPLAIRQAFNRFAW